MFNRMMDNTEIVAGFAPLSFALFCHVSFLKTKLHLTPGSHFKNQPLTLS